MIATYSKKKHSKRLTIFLLSMVILCVTISTTAFAKDFSDFTWLQSTSKKTIDLDYMSPGSNINTSGIKFSFTAYSPADGTFQVVLQRKGAFGIWQNVGGDSGKRTGYQGVGSGSGKNNLCVWPTNQSGEYRIILEKPTAPQGTGFTQVKAWAY